MRTKFTMGGLLVAGLLATSARAGDKITLKLRLEQGAEYKTVMKMDSTTHMQMGDQPMDMTMAMRSDGAMRVEAVDGAGAMTLKNTTTSVRAKMDGMMKMEYDSDKPETANNPMAKPMAAMVGKVVTVKIDANGQILDMEGEALNPATRAQLKNGFAQMTGWLPKQPVGVGDSWNYKMDMSGMAKMPVVMDVKCTLVGRKAGIAQVKTEGTMTGKMAGSLKGTMSIDEKTGWPESGNMEMTMKMAGPGQGPGVEVTVKTTQATTRK